MRIKEITNVWGIKYVYRFLIAGLSNSEVLVYNVTFHFSLSLSSVTDMSVKGPRMGQNG